MKYSLITCVFLIMIFSCKDNIIQPIQPEPQEPEQKEDVCTHLIRDYFLCDLHAGFIENDLLISPDPESYQNIYSWNDSNPVQREKFMALAEKHGDLTYERNKTRMPDPTESMAYAIDFLDIQIVSSSDWDENHPKGTSLNDLFTLTVRSHYHYIRNGYVIPEGYYYTSYFPEISKPLTELVEGDLWCLLGGRINLSLGRNRPSIVKQHDFTITLTTSSDPVILKCRKVF